MPPPGKSHKGFAADVWKSRLKRFAETGCWSEGNRPAKNQKRWHEIYKKIEKCPQMRNQPSLFGDKPCCCGYHKAPAGDAPSTTSSQAALPPTAPKEGFAKRIDEIIQRVSPRKPSQSKSAGPLPAPAPAEEKTPSKVKSKTKVPSKVKSTVPPKMTIAPKAEAKVTTKTQAPPKSTSTSTATAISTTATSTATSTATASSTKTTPTFNIKGKSGDILLLPEEWKHGIDECDHKWISNALYRPSLQHRQQLVANEELKLWYHPPPAPQIASGRPNLVHYFGHSLFCWMPLKMWRVRLCCPDCKDDGVLRAAGVYKVVRKVLDIDRFYYLVTENLQCPKCSKRLLGWSPVIQAQLDPGHKSLFPAVLTSMYACDVKVIRLLRERSLGNSASQLQKQIQEQHNAVWMDSLMQYLTACDALKRSQLFLKDFKFTRHPDAPVVPSAKWLLSIYAIDVLSRLDVLKAQLTSTYGNVLKLDSTKKVTKKLAGAGAKTAAWATNVGNERGEVLMTVLTAKEGSGLEAMARGLVGRYQRAKEPPPACIYVDRDCCSLTDKPGKTSQLFPEWPGTKVRLDPFHWMKRIALGVTTDAHPLYSAFMGNLSACIFVWDPRDMKILRLAKKSQLEQMGRKNLTTADIDRAISKKEMQKHCRRMTRGPEEIIRLVERLIHSFEGDHGKDSLGVPLLDNERIWQIWDVQKRHAQCLQDMPGLLLYTCVDSVLKGVTNVPVYRSARGSSSLESFHLHLNRFIPGTSASASHFQAYLIEGLVRWNEDRAVAAAGEEKNRIYSIVAKSAINSLCDRVYGRKEFPEFRAPGTYNENEKIGVEYLYNQTGKSLDCRFDPDKKTPEEDVIELDETEQSADAEGDLFMAPFDLNMPNEEDASDLELLEAEKEVMARKTIEQAAKVPIPQDPKDESASSADVMPTTSETVESAGDTEELPEPNLMRRDAEKRPASIAEVTESVEIGVEDTDEKFQEPGSVDSSNIPGYEKVDALAEYLFSLGTSKETKNKLSLTDDQVEAIVQLWTSLDEYDKRKVQYAARHLQKQIQGKFKTKKRKSTVVPGIESTERSFLGPHGRPASFPSCSRVVEALCLKLCQQHTKPRNKMAEILRQYAHVRNLVSDNARVIEETNLALVELSVTTVLQWYNNFQKRREKRVLLQGVDTLESRTCASKELAPAEHLLAERPVHEHPEFPFSEAADTSGFKKFRKRPQADNREPVSIDVMLQRAEEKLLNKAANPDAIQNLEKQQPQQQQLQQQPLQQQPQHQRPQHQRPQQQPWPQPQHQQQPWPQPQHQQQPWPQPQQPWPQPQHQQQPWPQPQHQQQPWPQPQHQQQPWPQLQQPWPQPQHQQQPWPQPQHQQQPWQQQQPYQQQEPWQQQHYHQQQPWQQQWPQHQPHWPEQQQLQQQWLTEAASCPAEGETMPRSTMYRKRLYKRSKVLNQCKTCGQPKTVETGHRQIKGFTFCPARGETYEDWSNRVSTKKD